MSALDLFGTPEGAHTPRANGLTPPTSNQSPNPVGTSPDSGLPGLIQPSERLEYQAFKWGIATGFVIGLGTGLIVFVGSQIVIGWWS